MRYFERSFRAIPVLCRRHPRLMAVVMLGGVVGAWAAYGATGSIIAALAVQLTVAFAGIAHIRFIEEDRGTLAELQEQIR